MRILHGSASGRETAEHSHADVQVSVHFARRSRPNVEPHHVHIYASQQPHSASWKRGEEVIVFHFCADLLSELRQELSQGSSFEVIPARSERDRIIEGLGLAVRDEFQSSDSLAGLYLESAGQLVALHLLRKHATFPIASTSLSRQSRHALTGEELDILQQFIHATLHRGFTVRELAAAIRVGPALLAQKLGSSMGLSPWRFVQQQRILRARALLRVRNRPIAEIATALGYTDQSHFTNMFRRATGRTPKSYRDAGQQL